MPGSATGDGDRARRRLAWERTGLTVAVLLLCWGALPGFWQNSMWLDEGYTRAAVDNIRVTMDFKPATNLFYLVGIWLWGQVSVAPMWLRLPSLVSSLGVVCLTRGIARRLAGFRCAVIAPAVVAVLPMFVAKSIEARGYAIDELIVAACWYCYLRSCERRRSTGRDRWLVGLVVLAALGPAFHALFFTELAAILVVGVLVRPLGREVGRLLPVFLACASSTVVLLRLNSGQRVGWFNVQSVSTGVAQGFLSGWPVLAVLLAILIVIAGAVDVQTYLRRRNPLVLAPLVWLVVPLVMLLLIRRFELSWDPRYLVPSIPAFAILIAEGLSVIAGRLARVVVPSGRHTLPVGISHFLPALLLCVVAAAGPRPSSELLENWNGAASYIAARAKDGDCLAFEYKTVGQRFRAPFESAWSGVPEKPRLRVISHPRQLGSVKIIEPVYSQQRIRQLAGRCDRVWLVDYRGSRHMHLQHGAPFTTTLHDAEHRTFEGDIGVTRYER
jgi:hypothetical protein